jgi:hypothetical protein
MPREWTHWLGHLFVAAIAMFGAYQIYCAWAYGAVYAGVPGRMGYREFASEPVWFAFGLASYAIATPVSAVLAYLGASSEIRGESFWRKRKSIPPIDTARRQRK